MNGEEFLAAPYHRQWFRDELGGWSAGVAELDGVFASGDSLEDAAANLDEAMLLWFEVEREAGREIPEPWGSREHSGTLNLRLPKSLHRRAAERAKIEGVSLNQLLVAAIASHLGDASTTVAEASTDLAESA